MVERREGANFIFEAFRETLTRNLDGDLSPQTAVACAVHFSHTARTERSKDFVWTEVGAGTQDHGIVNDFIAALRPSPVEDGKRASCPSRILLHAHVGDV